jgi:sulfur carrier protein ThiS
MRLSVKVFASLTSYVPGARAGIPNAIDLPEDASVADLIACLGLPADQVKLAFVNGCVRPTDWVLQAGDEIGIFPPVGGG